MCVSFVAQWCVTPQDHLMGKTGEKTTVTEVWTHTNVLLLDISLVSYFERFVLLK